MREELNTQIELINGYIDDLTNESKRKAVDDNRSDVNSLAYKVVQEATKIKTKDIS